MNNGVEALMTQAVTLLTPTDVTQNSIGEAIADDPTSLGTLMYLEPVSGTEEDPSRNTPVGDWRGAGKADVPFRSDCRIVYGDHVFSIIGDPKPAYDPLVGAVSHIEMDLQEIDDSTPWVVQVDAVAHPAAVGGTGGV